MFAVCTVLVGDVGRGILLDDSRPTFVSELMPLTIDSGDKAVLRVQARGHQPLSFQW